MKTCEIEGCEKQMRARGMCQMHYARWRKHGTSDRADPPGGPGKTNWKGDNASYSALHHRVKQARGRASQYPCQHCGGPAHSWCYDYEDPNELLSTTRWTMLASSDVNHYMPLCTPCHNAFDGKARTARHYELQELRRRVKECPCCTKHENES